jgi:effector-binding domain-containing protein
MTYSVEAKRVESQPIAAVRLRAGASDLSRVVPQACGEVWNYLRAHRVEGAGRHVAVYLDGQINLEVGAEVAHPFPSDGRVVLSSTPAGTVATTAHIGPYHGLHGAHAAVCAWCADNGRTMAGPNWEVYGHWDDDPSKLRTDVFYLLKDDGSDGPA